MPRSLSAVLVLAALMSGNCALSEDANMEFFEKKIRPVLVDYCYKCHSAETDEPAGGLLVDTRQGIRAGGETGPAVVPGDVKESLLVSAIEYNDLEMPPDEKLDDEIVEDFRKWIRMGAPDPRTKPMPERPDQTKAENPAPLRSLQTLRNPDSPMLQPAAHTVHIGRIVFAEGTGQVRLFTPDDKDGQHAQHDRRQQQHP